MPADLRYVRSNGTLQFMIYVYSECECPNDDDDDGDKNRSKKKKEATDLNALFIELKLTESQAI